MTGFAVCERERVVVKRIWHRIIIKFNFRFRARCDIGGSGIVVGGGYIGGVVVVVVSDGIHKCNDCQLQARSFIQSLVVHDTIQQVGVVVIVAKGASS